MLRPRSYTLRSLQALVAGSRTVAMRIVRLVSGCPPLSQLVCIESQMDFDTEKFITEVQSRPPIWNTKCLEHSDRVAKQKAWEELATVYGAGLSTEKRKQLGKNVNY